MNMKLIALKGHKYREIIDVYIMLCKLIEI